MFIRDQHENIFDSPGHNERKEVTQSFEEKNIFWTFQHIILLSLSPSFGLSIYLMGISDSSLC